VDNRKILTAILFVLMLSTFYHTASFPATAMQEPSQPAGTAVTVYMDDTVTVTWRHSREYILRGLPADAAKHIAVTDEDLIYHVSIQHNVLTNLGRNLIKSLLSQLAANNTGNGLLNYVHLSNATFTANLSSTYCCGGANHEYGSSAGLEPKQGTYASTGTGTWTITAIFTLTAAVATTAYGASLAISITAGAAANNEGAEALFATTAPMSAVGDNVTVVWACSVP
jgi:hypothetical protein